MDRPVSAKRLAQLEDFARRRGMDSVAALDETLTEHLEWEERDYFEAVDSIQEGLDDVKASRTQPASTFLAEFARKHGLPH